MVAQSSSLEEFPDDPSELRRRRSALPTPSSFDFIRFKQLLEQVLGREIDLVSYGGLKANVDDDIREAMLL